MNTRAEHCAKKGLCTFPNAIKTDKYMTKVHKSKQETQAVSALNSDLNQIYRFLFYFEVSYWLFMSYFKLKYT